MSPQYAVETFIDPFPMIPAYDSRAGLSFEAIGGISLNAGSVDPFPEITAAPGFIVGAPTVARFTANRKALVNRLKSVAGFSPRKTHRAILQTVRLSVNGTVELAATDLERSIVTNDDFDRSGDIAALVSPARILAVLKGMKSVDVDCELTADKLTIRSDRAALSVPAEYPLADYPAIAAPVADVTFIVNSSELAHAISQTIYATDTESTRYTLGGIMFELARFGEGNGPGVLTLVSTDTRRLSVSPVGSVDLVAGELDAKDTFVIPTGFLAAVAPFIDSVETVTVELTRARIEKIEASTEHDREESTREIPGYATFYASSFTATTQLIGGRFPAYRDVMPAQFNRELSFNRADLWEALTMASVSTSEECRGIDIEIPDECGSINVTIRGKAHGNESTGTVHAGQVDKGTAIGTVTYDPRFIMEYLRALPKTCKFVQLAIYDANSAAVLTAADESGHYIIMPLSRDR